MCTSLEKVFTSIMKADDVGARRRPLPLRPPYPSPHPPPPAPSSPPPYAARPQVHAQWNAFQSAPRLAKQYSDAYAAIYHVVAKWARSEARDPVLALMADDLRRLAAFYVDKKRGRPAAPPQRSQEGGGNAPS